LGWEVRQKSAACNSRRGVWARVCACCQPRVASVAAVCLHDEEILGSTGGTGRGLRETCFPTSLLSPFPRVTFFARPMMLLSNLFPVPCTPRTWLQSCPLIWYPEEAAVPSVREGILGVPAARGAPESSVPYLGRHSGGPQFHSAAPAGDAMMLPHGLRKRDGSKWPVGPRSTAE